MRARRQTWRCVALGLGLSGAGQAAREARASDAEPPVDPAPPSSRKYTPYVDRGMSLPAPYAYGTLGVAANVRIGVPTQLEWTLGGGVGLGPRVWIDGAVGTLRVVPELVFHSAQIGPNMLIVDTPPFELSATVHVSAPADDGRPIEQIEPGLYGVARYGHALRVDAGLFFDLNPGPKVTTGIRVPASFAFQLAEHVHAVVTTGVTTTSFAEAGRTTALPAGLTLGWSDYLHPTGPQSIGLLASLSFPELVKPWAPETFRPGYFIFGITFVYVTKS